MYANKKVAALVRDRKLYNTILKPLVHLMRSGAGGNHCSESLKALTAAYSLYRAYGFTEWAIDKDALCIDGVFYDEYLMQKDLLRRAH
ncbi:hypothetical protein [Tatumella ptyseos]|uniref:hypothetical protein n=1 Tax=Tatumella ptyseos TaxID=82987 RepID=UPI0023F20848|nr:hypothetical protein [Tatumella ptyseos]